MATIPLMIHYPVLQPRYATDVQSQLAQIAGLKQQNAMRALQVEQARREMADIEAFRTEGTDQGIQRTPPSPGSTLQDLSSPTAGVGTSIDTSQAGPITQSSFGPSGSASGSDGTMLNGLSYPGALSPGGQAVSSTSQPGAGAAAVPVSQQSSLPAPQPAPQEYPAEVLNRPPDIAQQAQDAGLPQPVAVQTQASANERWARYERMIQQHPYAWKAIGHDLMDMEKEHLAANAQEFGRQKDALGIVAQTADTVERMPPDQRQAAWSQYFGPQGIFTSWGLPGMDKIPGTYDAVTASAIAGNARTAQAKVESDQRAKQIEVDSIKAHALDLQARTAAGERVVVQTGQGPVMVPKSAVAGTGVEYLPVPGKEQEVAAPPEAARTEPLYDAAGNLVVYRPITPPGKTPQVMRLQMPPDTTRIPAYAPGTPTPGTPAAPTPGTPAAPTPGTPAAPPPAGGGLETPAMHQERVLQERGQALAISKEDMTARQNDAREAEAVTNTLSEMKALAHEGYYSNIKASQIAGNADIAKVALALGVDPQKLSRTQQLMNLSSRLNIEAQNGRVARVNPDEIKKITTSTGSLETLPPPTTMFPQIDTLRRLNLQKMQLYNNAVSDQPATVHRYNVQAMTPMSRGAFEQNYRRFITQQNGRYSRYSRGDYAAWLERHGKPVEGVVE